MDLQCHIRRMKGIRWQLGGIHFCCDKKEQNCIIINHLYRTHIWAQNLLSPTKCYNFITSLFVGSCYKKVDKTRADRIWWKIYNKWDIFQIKEYSNILMVKQFCFHKEPIMNWGHWGEETVGESFSKGTLKDDMWHHQLVLLICIKAPLEADGAKKMTTWMHWTKLH